MTTFGKRKGGGRRRAAREHLPLIAVFTTRSRSHPAVLVDVSSTGVRLRGDDLPGRGEDLLVTIEGVTSYGVVAWSRLGFCGIAFDSPLPAGSLQLLEQRVAKARGLSPELMAAMEDWQLGVAR
jgi:hypothetical protein